MKKKLYDSRFLVVAVIFALLGVVSTRLWVWSGLLGAVGAVLAVWSFVLAVKESK
jgi:uncharacterized membrane protein YjjB (DUF3815 family)